MSRTVPSLDRCAVIKIKNMKYSYVRDVLTEMMYEILISKEFKYRKSTKEFIRKVETGYHAVSILITNYAPEFNVDLSVSIRLEEVQIRLNDFFLYDDNGKKNGTTINAGLGFLLDEDINYELEITSENQLQEVKEKIREVIQEKVSGYFEKYNDISNIDKELNSNSTEPNSFMYWAVDRAFIGTIVAKMNANPDYEKLVSNFTKEISEQNEQHLERYKGLLKSLSNE